MPACLGGEDSELYVGFACVLQEGHPGAHRDRDGYERARPNRQPCPVPHCILPENHPEETHQNSEGDRWFSSEIARPPMPSRWDRPRPEERKSLWERLLEDAL